ncbi:MAG: hypothetical protein ACTSYS_02340 [Promethearchaeota archaeon]
MKKKKVNKYTIGLILLFVTFIFAFLVPFNANSREISSPKISRSAFDDKADNTYYGEWLRIRVLKDNSLLKDWRLLDKGMGNIDFPISLPTPLNSSSSVLQDLQIRFAVVRAEQLPKEWGPMTSGYVNSYTFTGQDSIFSQLMLYYVAELDDLNNASIADKIIENLTNSIQAKFTGVKFYQTTRVTMGGGHPRLVVTYRAFPSDSVLKTIIKTFLSEYLPENNGLFTVDENKFVESRYSNIQITANWEGDTEWAGDSYEDDPWIDGTTEYNDNRWEMSAGIIQLQENAVKIKSGQLNTLYFKDIFPYKNALRSHPDANASEFWVQLYHGCKLVAAKPNFQDSSRARATYNLDMIDDTNEVNYTLPETAHLNFTFQETPVPVLIAFLSADDPNIANGDNVTLTYSVTNIGDTTAYDLELNDHLNTYPLGNLTGNYHIMAGDDDKDGNINTSWSQLNPGDTVSFQAVINYTGGVNDFMVTNGYLMYHAAPSSYSDTSEWARNPNNYDNGYMVEFNNLGLLGDSQGPVIQYHVNMTKFDVDVGDIVNVTINLKNIGEINSTNTTWQSPILGINKTAVNGIIPVIEPGESVTISIPFVVDFPMRYMGDFIDYYYATAGQFTMGYVSDNLYWPLYGNSLVFNLLPSEKQFFGPLVYAWRTLSEVEINGETLIQVSIHAKNFGTLPAYSITLNDYLPLENFSIVSGSTNYPVTWNILPAGSEISYSYILEAPNDVTIKDTFSYLLVQYTITSYNFFRDNTWASMNTHAFSPPTYGVGDDVLIGLIIGMIAIGVCAGLFLLAWLDERGTTRIFKR